MNEEKSEEAVERILRSYFQNEGAAYPASADELGREKDDSEHLSLGAVIHLVEGRLDEQGRAAAIGHIVRCSKCRNLLTSTIRTLGTNEAFWERMQPENAHAAAASSILVQLRGMASAAQDKFREQSDRLQANLQTTATEMLNVFGGIPRQTVPSTGWASDKTQPIFWGGPTSEDQPFYWSVRSDSSFVIETKDASYKDQIVLAYLPGQGNEGFAGCIALRPSDEEGLFRGSLRLDMTIRDAPDPRFIKIDPSAITLADAELIREYWAAARENDPAAAEVWTRWIAQIKDSSAREAIYEETLILLLASLEQAKDRGLRLSAAEALGDMGATALRSDVLSALLNALEQQEDGELRGRVVAALEKMAAPAPKNIVESPLEALDQRADLRKAAADALRKMGITVSEEGEQRA